MGKYTVSTTAIFGQFTTAQWVSTGILAVPADFQPPQGTLEYVRVSVLHGNSGINARSTSGIINIDIFTQNGLGPARGLAIADMLDEALSWIAINDSGYIQTGVSSLSPIGVDGSNPALQRHLYTTQFNYFGV